jgi:hypothetical protein
MKITRFSTGRKQSLAESPVRWLAVLLVVVTCSVTNARADGTNKVELAGGSTKAKGKEKPTVAERPQLIGATTTTTADKPARPTATGTTPAETAKLISDFQTARQQYLETQKEISLKLKTGTEEQRMVLREKSKEALDKWREDHRRYVEEQKERARQMKLELQPEIGVVVDSAGEGIGGGRGR